MKARAGSGSGEGFLVHSRSLSPHVPSMVGGLPEISEVSVYNSGHGAPILVT